MDRVCRSVSGHSPTYVLSVIVGWSGRARVVPLDARAAMDQQRGEVAAKRVQARTRLAYRRYPDQRLVSYLVSTMPPGNVRVSTRFKLTQLSSAVKNGVPPPTNTG